MTDLLFATEDEAFESVDFTSRGWDVAEYERCTFTSCDLSGVELGATTLSDCAFIGCNLSMLSLVGASLQDVRFKDCKLMGVRFDACNPWLFEVAFDGCLLNLASFFRLQMRKTAFRRCAMRETDLAGADLTEAVFDDCDLLGAIFENTTLPGADFRTARGFAIHPESNGIKGAKFSAGSLSGLLLRYELVVE